MNEEEKELEYIDFEEILDIVKIKQGKSNFSITKTNQILQDSQYQYNLIDKWKCFQISESKIKFKNIKIKVIDSIHNNKDNYGYISIDRTRFRVKSLEFTECKIDNMYFEKSTFITDLELNNSNVECLKITNSTLDNFLINKKRSTYSIHFLKNNDIKCIYARSNKFSKNFSISSCDIKSFEFIDNNFLKKIRIKNINFEGLMVFDTCHFYSKTVFEQVT
ncbi:MAG: hypothetical protein U9N49_06995, partial [Campylobacterota bacterium]|nr:hypothetical protein [Campylobacterota bacterium]